MIVEHAEEGNDMKARKELLALLKFFPQRPKPPRKWLCEECGMEHDDEVEKCLHCSSEHILAVR